MIRERYTLFSRIPLYVDGGGAVHAGDLWEKDLAHHLTYIENFRICCPVLPASEKPASAKPVAGLRPDRITALALDRGWGSVIRNLLPNFLQVARAARGSEVVHSGGAGWAFPLSYYILALRPFLRFKWIMVIESSFWMKPEKGPASLRQRLSHLVHGTMVRACVRAADAHIFTQAWYRDLFLPAGVPAHVAPAVWIDAQDIVSAGDHAARPPKRGDGPARLIFPARLVPDKGVDTVLEAITLYEARQAGTGGAALEVDIIGAGALADRCRAFAAEPRRAVRVRFLEQVPYGAPFFALIGGYEAVLVANRQPEQPRIIFDAFSQAVPCIATRTPGIETILTEGRTGWLFAVDDAAGLADLFGRAVEQAETLARMGGTAREEVAGRTHADMHRARERFLKERLCLSGDAS